MQLWGLVMQPAAALAFLFPPASCGWVYAAIISSARSRSFLLLSAAAAVAAQGRGAAVAGLPQADAAAQAAAGALLALGCRPQGGCAER